MTAEAPAAELTLQDVCKKDPGAWFEVFGKIKNNVGQVIVPRMNALQRDIVEAYSYCMEMGIPCRIISLKPRQRGNSTITVNLAYHHCQTHVCSAVIIGGQYSQVDNLWKILKTTAVHDGFPWGKKANIKERAGVFPVTGSTFERETARDDEAGRSGTIQFLICTEAARWSEGGVRDASAVLTGILACVHEEPGTVVVLESTAKGPSGPFYDTWNGSVSLDEMKAGKLGNGYIRVFRGWHEFPELRLRLSPEQRATIIDSYTDEERFLEMDYSLDPEQIAWRRRKIAGECQGDVAKFDREYPLTPDHAFRASQLMRFSPEALYWNEETQLNKVSRTVSASWSNEEQAAVGYAVDPGGVITMWEGPQEGMAYLIAVDPATGISQAMGKDPDSHSVLVLRRGFHHHDLGYQPTCIVARLGSPCQWDIDVLEERVAMLATLYQAIVVPEMNMDRGLVELLKKRGGINIYQRETMNLRENKVQNALGWMTTTATREPIIEELAYALRLGPEPGGLVVACPNVLEQLRFFHIGPNGKAQAAEGKHDDDVMALAIGNACISKATVWRQPKLKPTLPPDLRALLASRRKKADGSWAM